MRRPVRHFRTMEGKSHAAAGDATSGNGPDIPPGASAAEAEVSVDHGGRRCLEGRRSAGPVGGALAFDAALFMPEKGGETRGLTGDGADPGPWLPAPVRAGAARAGGQCPGL